MMGRFLAVICATTLMVLNACGQDHQQNLTWLQKVKETEKYIVVLNNSKAVLPVKQLENIKFATVNIGFNFQHDFDSLLNKYTHVPAFSSGEANYQDLNALHDDLKYYNYVVVSITDSAATNPKNIQFIKQLENQKNVAIALFGKGESLARFDSVAAPIVWSKEKTMLSAQLTAQIIFGGEGSTTKLPATFSDKYILGTGFETFATRLGYTVPEAVDINSDDLKEIDRIAAEAVSAKATPGCAVLVAKNGKVIFNKAYGFHTYNKEQANSVTDIYDLASVTKVAATTMDVMKLYEEGKIDLEAPISDYLYRTKNTDKADIKVKEVMLHQAGFIPYIPFYDALKPADYRRDSSADFSVKVADSFYLKNNYYKDVMWEKMLKSPLRTRGKYVYSDLSMYFMKEIVEGITSKTLPVYTSNSFYNKLGMYSTMFNPRNRFQKERIVPTEQDNYFRKTLLWGYVHDQGAAMAGGVSGHAGLFSDITDLAILNQMLLNKGSYGGITYFKPETVALFTKQQSDVSRRGLGFDRWEPNTTKEYPSKFASPQTFGHTGYTGTCVWVDPAENLVYIFLSNRVNPSVNNKLSSLNIRPRIQDVVYKAIKKGSTKISSTN